jgi:hypothetical protein
MSDPVDLPFKLSATGWRQQLLIFNYTGFILRRPSSSVDLKVKELGIITAGVMRPVPSKFYPVSSV